MSAYLTYYIYIAPLAAPQSGRGHDIKLQVIEADGVLMDGCSINDIVEVAPGQRLSVLVDPYAWATKNNNRAGTYNIVVTANPYEFRHVQANAKRATSGDPKYTNKACYNGPETFNDLRVEVPYHLAQIKLGDKATTPTTRAWSFYLPKMLLSASDETNRLCFPHISGCTAAADTYSISTNFIDFDDAKLQPLVPSSLALPSDQRHRFVIQTWEDKSGDKPTRRANLRVIRSDIQSNMDNANGYTFFAPQDRPALEQIRQGDTNWDPWKHVMILPTEAKSYIIALYSWTGTHPSKPSSHPGDFGG